MKPILLVAAVAAIFVQACGHAAVSSTAAAAANLSSVQVAADLSAMLSRDPVATKAAWASIGTMSFTQYFEAVAAGLNNDRILVDGQSSDHLLDKFMTNRPAFLALGQSFAHISDAWQVTGFNPASFSPSASTHSSLGLITLRVGYLAQTSKCRDTQSLIGPDGVSAVARNLAVDKNNKINGTDNSYDPLDDRTENDVTAYLATLPSSNTDIYTDIDSYKSDCHATYVPPADYYTSKPGYQNRLILPTQQDQ